MSASARALSIRSGFTAPPCTMPNAACPGAPAKALRERSAQRSDSRIARSASASPHGSRTHSSNCICMSEPSSA